MVDGQRTPAESLSDVSLIGMQWLELLWMHTGKSRTDERKERRKKNIFYLFICNYSKWRIGWRKARGEFHYDWRKRNPIKRQSTRSICFFFFLIKRSFYEVSEVMMCVHRWECVCVCMCVVGKIPFVTFKSRKTVLNVLGVQHYEVCIRLNLCTRSTWSHTHSVNIFTLKPQVVKPLWCLTWNRITYCV